FWKKFDNPVFGAYVADLGPEDRVRLQTNRGLKVRAMMKGSPVFNADIFQDDIITAIDGESPPIARQFYAWVIQKAGQTIELEIRRGDKTIRRSVSLGKIKKAAN
ncbi:MAG: hypothetical protein ABII00_05320, partial [Elusimicrobiota bacterium]